MLKSCKYCGRIHDSKHDCGMKPARRKKNTEADRFRWSKQWQRKRDEIRQRDSNLCQVCIRQMFGGRQYTYEDLSVHHGIPLEEDFDKRLDNDNLITLCGYHHEMAEKGAIPREIILKIIAEQEEKASPPGVEI